MTEPKKSTIFVLDFLELGGATRIVFDAINQAGTSSCLLAGHSSQIHFNLKEIPSAVARLTYRFTFFKSTVLTFFYICLATLRHSFRLVPLIQDKKNSVIYLNMAFSGLGILLNPLLWGVPKIFVFHGALYQEFLSRYRHGRKSSKVRFVSMFLYAVQRLVMARCVKVVVFSRFSAAIASSSFHIPKHKVIQVRPPVSLPAVSQRFLNKRSAAARKKTVFLFPSRIEPRKGFDLLVEALPFLSTQVLQQCVFIVCGEIMDQSYFMHQFLQLKERGHAQYFQFMATKSRPEMFELYRSVDCSLMLSVEGETLGLVTLESLSQGTPVIGNNATATAEILSLAKKKFQKLIMFKNNDNQDLAQKLSFFVSLSMAEKQELKRESQRVFNQYMNDSSRITLTDLVATAG